MKRLSEHPDFDVLVRNTAASLTLRPELVLKDYWVSAILRVLATPRFRGSLLFKGGTSLSKGWKLIDRFSEDIDLLLTGSGLSAPPERKGDRERFMKELRDYILAELPLQIPNVNDPRIRYRDEWHVVARYFWKLTDPVSLAADQSVLLEAGYRGGVNPHTTVSLNSMVGDYLLTTPQKDSPELQDYRGDFTPFDFDLLTPSRTFFEKLLHIHGSLDGKVSDLRTRHIYDIVQISQRVPEIKQLIQSGDYRPILENAVEVSNRWYDAKLDPDKIDFHAGLVMNDEAAAVLEPAYKAESDYYYRGQPSFAELRAGLEEIRLTFPEKEA